MVKTITITDMAYNKLSARKEGSESFSEVVMKLTKPKSKLSDFVGVISKDTAKKLELAVKENRKRASERTERIRKELQK